MSATYLDYAASTPLDPRVSELMLKILSAPHLFGNPGSTAHEYGWAAHEAIELAREQVARAIHADVKEIIWTSGATEANNLAIIGYALAHADRGKHIITCQTEHKSVLGPCQYLEKMGYQVTYLKPEKSGLILLENFNKAIRPDTLLASIMLVNNETGVIQDIAKLTEIAHQHQIVMHVDAVQALGKMPVDVKTLDVDLLSLSAHKAYGPKGVGALYIKRKPRIKITPLIHGGGQEQGLRAGTLATHQIIGMGLAVELASAELQNDTAKLSVFKDRMCRKLSQLPKTYFNGDISHSVPGILSVSFEGVDGEAMLMALRDIAVSSGSACTSTSIEPSHVLRAMGLSDTLAHSTIRFSFGRFTTDADIDKAIESVYKEVTRLRTLSPLWK